MRKLACIVLLIFVSGWGIKAQESPDFRKWGFLYSFGLSLPIGQYKSISSPDMYWIEHDGREIIKGFPKKGYGSAEIGNLMELTIFRNFRNRFSMGLSGSIQNNSINKKTMEETYKYQYGGDQLLDIQHDAYQIWSIKPTIGYLLLSKSKLEMKLVMGVGYAQQKYTYYWFQYPYSPFYYGHIIEMEDISSIIFQVGTTLEYKITKSLNILSTVTFNHSNFAYNNIMGGWPGGGFVMDFIDVVNMRSINLGLGISCSFGKFSNIKSKDKLNTFGF
jgi:hypothetical protein